MDPKARQPIRPAHPHPGIDAFLTKAAAVLATATITPKERAK